MRMIGDDLQWVVRVEKVGHVDQINVEFGIVFRTAPLATRDDCRVLWSLPDLPGVEADDVARALVATGNGSLAEREELIGGAIALAADFVRAHRSTAQVRDAFARGRLKKAFVFRDARELLESP